MKQKIFIFNFSDLNTTYDLDNHAALHIQINKTWINLILIRKLLNRSKVWYVTCVYLCFIHAQSWIPNDWLKVGFYQKNHVNKWPLERILTIILLTGEIIQFNFIPFLFTFQKFSPWNTEFFTVGSQNFRYLFLNYLICTYFILYKSVILHQVWLIAFTYCYVIFFMRITSLFPMHFIDKHFEGQNFFRNFL